MGEVLLFLVDGEQYSPTGTSLNVDQLPNQPTVPETTPDESLPVTEGTSHAQFPQISAIPLPELSGSTRASLMEGDMARCVWLQLIEESKNYYMKFFPVIETNPYGVYRTIGQKMVKAYPSIEREGTHPWSQFTKALGADARKTLAE
ncbi:hypothetical protein Pcinc_001959 [Petrolisthes cinctipes]|uniref:Uncharacterized protein n=1 Tax=Petrolisthes cinctipes TaxID=88211 RepID=A0AAE1L2N6_PETCI|nr:hypothetical protein Pcinc_001959 [Petrolisthes cinctipes]